MKFVEYLGGVLSAYTTKEYNNFQDSFQPFYRKGALMKYRKLTGYKYQLMARECFDTPYRPGTKIYAPFIRLGKTGRMQVLKGFAWNGASGPTIDTESTMRASLAHDCGYQLIREKWLPFPMWKDNKAKADTLFYHILKEDGMGKIRAWYYHKAVKWFGASSCRPTNL